MQGRRVVPAHRLTGLARYSTDQKAAGRSVRVPHATPEAPKGPNLPRHSVIIGHFGRAEGR